MLGELLHHQKDAGGRLELGPALLGSPLDIRGDPDSMLTCLSFSVKTSCTCTLSANTKPDAQGAALSDVGDPKGEVKTTGVYSICQ